MLIICNEQTVNLDNFESVRYRESWVGDGYPVEAIRNEVSGAIFGGTNEISEELVRMKYKKGASLLVADITAAMGYSECNMTRTVEAVNAYINNEISKPEFLKIMDEEATSDSK